MTFYNLSQTIRPDCEIYGNDGTHWTPDDIQNGVNYWKQAIYTALGGKTVGKTVWISTSTFFIIVCCMKAAWELGANVFNQEFQQGTDDVPAFKNFYDFVTIKIVHNDFGFKLNHHFLYISEFNPKEKYPHIEYTLDQPISDKTIAVTTHTSGTTGLPKIIEYTHRIAIDKLAETIALHNWVEDDVPIHYKTLHHSSLFMDYALPLLSLCKVHHSAEGNYAVNFGEFDNSTVFFNRILPYIKKNNVTQMLCPYDWINYMPKAEPVDFEQRLSFFTTPGVRLKETLVTIFDQFNLRQVNTVFGTSELGLMCISKARKDAMADFEVGKFDFINHSIEYELFDTHTKCRRKGTQNWVTLSDILVNVNDCMYFKGRNEKLVVSGITVDVAALRQNLSQTFNAAFSLVTDYELNQMYLACYDDNIPLDISVVNKHITDHFSKEYEVTKVAKLDVSQIRRGIKPSSPLLLFYFRSTQLSRVTY
jgi:hypothetical protein